MDIKNISITTITWARDEQEEELLKRSLQKLSELNIPVFIADGGSGTTFLNFLQQFPHFNVFKSSIKGVFAQAKNSLYQAANAGAGFILYTEPDKHDFFYQLPAILNELAVDEQIGITLASRSESSFNTFPSFQQMTETTINNCIAELIGKATDYTYGPFILNSKLVTTLSLVQDEIGWGWRPYIFGTAFRLGYKIQNFTGNFSCPEDQRKDNHKERLYRMRQLTQNIEGLLRSTIVSLP